jgi:hypothetical protein
MMMTIPKLAALALAAVFLFAVEPAAARDCEAWSGRSQIRCLTSGAAADTGETVTVRNHGVQTVLFSMQKWFSVCGMDSEHEPTLVKNYELAAGSEAILTTALSLGLTETTTCTELFIFDCRAGDQWVACAEALDAKVALQSPAPPVTPPLRRQCEPWKGGSEFRCLSSYEDAYTLEPVQVQGIFPGEVTFSVQEWYSLCNYANAVPPTAKETHHLAAGASAVLPGKELPGEVTKFNPAVCREIFIFECRAGGTTVPCSARLVATIGQ